jgi:hypothetical protein
MSTPGLYSVEWESVWNEAVVACSRYAISTEGLRKTTQSCQDSWRPSQDSNRSPTECQFAQCLFAHDAYKNNPGSAKLKENIGTAIGRIIA